MIKRTAWTLAASVTAVLMAGSLAAAQDTLKIGASAPKTGPLAGGAAVTHWPNIKLWVQEVNNRGGLKVGGKQMKVELIEYDDKTSAEEAVKNIQRLATVQVSGDAGDMREMIAEAVYAVTHRGTLGHLSRTIHPYPTQVEALRKAGDMYRRQALTAGVRTWLTRYFDWTR